MHARTIEATTIQAISIQAKLSIYLGWKGRSHMRRSARARTHGQECTSTRACKSVNLMLPHVTIRLFTLPVAMAHVARRYTGHNYIGHTYTGHNSIGHNYVGHSYVGHNYTGHNYIMMCHVTSLYLLPWLVRRAAIHTWTSRSQFTPGVKDATAALRLGRLNRPSGTDRCAGWRGTGCCTHCRAALRT